MIAPQVHAKVDAEVSGHARTRMVFEDNAVAGAASDTDAVEHWENKVRFNFDVMPANGLKVRISPQFTHYFGAEGGDNAKFTAKEAWMMYSPNNMVSLYVGRQQVALGNEKIFGSNSWFQDTRVHDAVRASFDFDMGMAHLLYVKAIEGTKTTPTTRDADLFGFYASFDKLSMLKVVDAYAVWKDKRNAVAADRARFGTFGLRAAADFNAIDMDAELTANFGKVAGNDIKGIAGDLQVGYNWMDNRVGLGLTYANSEYQELYPTTHRAGLRGSRYLGDAGIFNMNNIMAFSLLTNWALSKEFEASLDGWWFMAAKDDLGTVGGKTSAAKRNAGLEGDLAIAYMPMDMIAFQTGYALFKPMSGLDDAGSDKIVHRAYLQGLVKF